MTSLTAPLQPAAPVPATAPLAAAPPAWTVVLALVLVPLAVYLPALWSAQFLNFDDPFFFGPTNDVFRRAAAAAEQGGLFAGLAVVWTPQHVVADVWLPVAHGSLFVDYWWSGSAPLWPHLHSLLLHVLAGVVLWRALRALGAHGWLAATAALLFLVHPALCESVAWVSGRKDVLSGLFVFLALWASAVFVRTPGRAWPLLAVALCTALAMYSKATAVVLPLLLALVALRAEGTRRRWWPALVALLVTVPIAVHHQQIAAAAGTLAGGSALDRLPQAPGAFLHYLATALWPSGLNVLHPEVQTLERFRAAWLPASIALLAVVAVAALAWRRPQWGAVAFGLPAFALALLPFNTAFPASSVAAADRYLYLAVPFLALAVAAALGRLARLPWLPAILLGVPLAIAAGFRAQDFTSSERLWESSLAVDADNAVAWIDLYDARYGGRGVFDAGARELVERAQRTARYPEHRRLASRLLVEFARAEGLLQRAAQHAEDAIAAADEIAASGRHGKAAAERVQLETLVQAALPLREGGRRDEADAAVRRAKAIAPEHPAVLALQVLFDVDDLLVEARQRAAQGGDAGLADDDPRVRSVRERLDAALQQWPDDPQLNLAAGQFARVRGQRFVAVRYFRAALTSEPGLTEGWHGAAQVCLDAGLYEDAENYARDGIAAQLRRGQQPDPRLRLSLARAMAGRGALDDAIRHLKDYWLTNPRDRDAARVLSSLLMAQAISRLSDPGVTHAELQRLCDEALAAHPQEPRVDIVRARLCRDRREFAQAVAALDRVRQVLPDYHDAVPMLADNLRDLGYERLLAGDDDGAADAWLRFLDLAGKDTPTEAVRGALGAIWRRTEEKGIAAKQRGDREGAVRAFRRCLEIDPDQHWASWQLVNLLLDDDAADPAELDRLSQQALDWQVRHGLDRSRQLLVRVVVLRRLGRHDDASRLASEYLASPDEDAPAAVLDLVRAHGR